MYDPTTEPTRQVNLSPWEIAKLYQLANSPAAAVYGQDNNLRMIALYAKLGTVMQDFINAGQIEPATGQVRTRPTDVSEVNKQSVFTKPEAKPDQVHQSPARKPRKAP